MTASDSHGPDLKMVCAAVAEIFASLGGSCREMLDLKRVDPTYHLVFDDGRQLALTSDMKSMQEQLET